eukprot:jgi/Bigna1/79374/fgenesh1_pg.62_\
MRMEIRAGWQASRVPVWPVEVTVSVVRLARTGESTRGGLAALELKLDAHQCDGQIVVWSACSIWHSVELGNCVRQCGQLTMHANASEATCHARSGAPCSAARVSMRASQLAEPLRNVCNSFANEVKFATDEHWDRAGWLACWHACLGATLASWHSVQHCAGVWSCHSQAGWQVDEAQCVPADQGCPVPELCGQSQWRALELNRATGASSFWACASVRSVAT